MAQQTPPKNQVRYQDVQLLPQESLGSGSYGKVCKAILDQLPCAAKLLHPVLFQFNDPGDQTIIRRFEQECKILSDVRHPNIVQYLGVTRDPESGQVILLMELMDESLTGFLERSNKPLPYNLQVNLCHDVALALAYLHSNSIIHRDLSSNNVLLIAGYRAKLSDFGMSKLSEIHPHMTPLTRCPGTPVYMPPEALEEPPVYSNKLDIFSSGVVAVQIMACRFPNPGPPTTKIKDARYPLGTVLIPVLEVERRKNHIDLINPTHPLLPVARDCLKNNEGERPSAQELCYRIAALKDKTTSVEERCVVVLGKSGAGKSTVANMILGYDPLAKYPPFNVSKGVLESVTRSVTYAMAEFYRNGIKYKVKVVDTVGLFDGHVSGNNPNFDNIERYFNDHSDGVNLFLFVLKKGRFTEEEHEVFTYLMSKLKQDISPISALVFTSCEFDPPKVREELVQEFRDNPLTKEIALHMRLGLYPVGFPPLKTMLPTLAEFYQESMTKDRETLLDLVISSKDTCWTKKLFEDKVKPKGWSCTIQ